MVGYRSPSQVAALAPGEVMAPSETAVAHHNSLTLLRLGFYSLLSSSVP